MGLTVIDAGVLIGFLDSNDAHHDAAERALRDVLERGDRIALPASAFAEAIVAPSRTGRHAVGTVRDLVRRVPIEVAALDDDTAVAAAHLRARHRSLKLPDALVIAAAVALDADHLVTTDRQWPPRSKLGLRAQVTRL
jgi:predicted nucleic acid-binding protein